MKTIKFCFSFLFMVLSFTLYSQGVHDELKSNQIFAEAFLTSNKEFSSNEGPKISKGNSVFIQQIGSEHTAISNVTSKTSSLNFSQEGKGNYINLKAHVNNVVENIVQNGEYNNIFEDIYAPESNISLNLTQNGRNHHFERYGSNSIGDKLEFTMNGSETSIIVRNFK